MSRRTLKLWAVIFYSSGGCQILHYANKKSWLRAQKWEKKAEGYSPRRIYVCAHDLLGALRTARTKLDP